MDISDTLVRPDEGIDNDNSKIVMAADIVKKITRMPPRFNNSTSTNMEDHKKSSQCSTSCMKSSALPLET